MTDEQLVKVIEAVKPQPPGIWPVIERGATVIGLALSVVTLLVFVQIRDQVEMMKVYQRRPCVGAVAIEPRGR